MRQRDRRHLRRECEVVRLMLEQRIRHHLDFVKMNSFVELGDARRKHGRDEMHVMPTLGKIASELRTDDAAPAVSWINRDTNIHKPKLIVARGGIEITRTFFSYFPGLSYCLD